MNDSSPLEGFSGKARLFPLPNLVFFPHVLQPLHIFEPRYRQMTADALDGDRIIAMVLPLPGWEKDYAATPAIHTIACAGRIMAEQQLEDGRYHLLLRGLARIRIVNEMPLKKLYRTARAELLDDAPLLDESKICQWRRTLTKKTPEWFSHSGEIIDQFHKLLASDMSLGILCDIMAFALPVDMEFKQTLLEELDVEQRLTMMYDFLEAKQNLAAVTQRKFPPEFSAN